MIGISSLYRKWSKPSSADSFPAKVKCGTANPSSHWTQTRECGYSDQRSTQRVKVTSFHLGSQLHGLWGGTENQSIVPQQGGWNRVSPTSTGPSISPPWQMLNRTCYFSVWRPTSLVPNPGQMLTGRLVNSCNRITELPPHRMARVARQSASTGRPRTLYVWPQWNAQIKSNCMLRLTWNYH